MDFAYNAAGELVWQRDARGLVTTLGYDRLGRIVSRNNAEGTVSMEYDDAPGAGVGKASRSTSSNGQREEFLYDSLGRLERKIKRILNPRRGETEEFHFRFRYDEASRLTQLEYPNGIVADYGYGVTGDPLSLMGIRFVNSNPQTIVNYRAESFNAFGAVVGETIGAASHSRIYNPETGLMESSVVNALGQAVFNSAYDWDLIGNLVRRTDVINVKTEVFNYDALNRVTSSTLNGIENLSVSYALNGNILTKTGQGAYIYADAAHPHAVTQVTGPGGGGFNYDASGNLLSGAGCTASYTTFNKPTVSFDSVSGSHLEYTYGVSDEVVVQHEVMDGLASRTTLYADNLFELVMEDDDVPGGAEFDRVTEQNAFVINGRVIAVAATVSDQNGPEQQTQYLHYDHLGSLIGLLDTAGAVVARYSFDAFGQRRAANWSTGPPATPHPGSYRYTSRGYTGHLATQASSLVHMGGRLYHSALGRFFSADPVVTDPSSGQDYNGYTYVSNNPLSYHDPSGYSWFSKAWKKATSWAQRTVVDPVVEAAKKVGKWIENNWRVLVVVVVAVVITILSWGTLSPVAVGLIVGATTGALAPALQGRPIGEILKGAVIGAVAGAITGGAGGLGSGILGAAIQIAAAGVAGGIRATAYGGSFWKGFQSAAITAGVSAGVSVVDPTGLQVVSDIAAGGISNSANGQDFGDGVAFAAFSYAAGSGAQAFTKAMDSAEAVKETSMMTNEQKERELWIEMGVSEGMSREAAEKYVDDFYVTRQPIVEVSAVTVKDVGGAVVGIIGGVTLVGMGAAVGSIAGGVAIVVGGAWAVSGLILAYPNK